MEISSLTNAKIKRVCRLQKERRFRHREGVFVAEGTRWMREIITHQVTPTHLFYTQQWAETAVHKQLLPQLHPAPTAVTPSVMNTMSDMHTAAGVLALLPIQPQPIPPNPNFILVLDGINTPGNLGTMLRTAGAARVDVILLAPQTVDLYNPKVIRGGMGAHLRLPIHHLEWAEIKEVVQNTAVTIATINAQTPYTAINWQAPSTLIIGNEAHGASPPAQQLAHTPITIPMHKKTESLNAATAAAIILFEAARQKQAANVSSQVDLELTGGA